MTTIALSWEHWRSVIAVLLEKTVPCMLGHADDQEVQRERHDPDEAMARPRLTGVVLRTDTRARWQLAIPLPAE